MKKFFNIVIMVGWTINLLSYWLDPTFSQNIFGEITITIAMVLVIMREIEDLSSIA